MKTTRILQTKRDRSPLFPKEPCPGFFGFFFFFLLRVPCDPVIALYQINSAKSRSQKGRSGKDPGDCAAFLAGTKEETEAQGGGVRACSGHIAQDLKCPARILRQAFFPKHSEVEDLCLRTVS